jgi:hypothetical protein
VGGIETVHFWHISLGLPSVEFARLGVTRCLASGSSIIRGGASVGSYLAAVVYPRATDSIPIVGFRATFVAQPIFFCLV